MRTFYLRLLSVLTLIAMTVASGTAIVSAASPSVRLAATVSYTADNATVFKNPERGFHNRYEIINDPAVSDYIDFNSGGCNGSTNGFMDRTFACAKAAGNTLIHSYIHLDKYKTTDILPQALLDNLSAGLAAIRAAGMKIVLRPAYEWSGLPTVPEARIIGHINQINTVISANIDVVAYMEGGYLGPWGEWHSSLYTDYTSQTEGQTRYRIVKAMLDSSPASLPIVIRYPMALKEILEIAPPAGSTALTQTDRDRLGFHNDCFLYNDADRGTYDKSTWLGTFSIAQQQQYVFDMTTSYGGNKMVGGETCDGNGRNDAGALTVQSEMAALNFTEINNDYWDGAINVWKAANLAATGNDPAETAFVRLQRKMGYRLRLVDATFPTSATAGGSFTFSANLSNDGYSSIVRTRPIFLVLENASNRFDLQMNGVDVRKWVSGPNTLAQQTLTLPSNMPAGTYKLALWLPDNASGLRSRPEYSIRFANQGTWDSAMGYNVLSSAITITGSGAATATSMPSSTRTPTQTLTPTATLTPNGYAVYEAESASNTVANGAGVVGCSTCSGGNKVGNVGNNAGTLQFNGVNGTSAGSYTLTIYHINGDAGARNATISVNGGAGTSLSFPATGSWTALGFVQTTINLNAGTGNTILFSNSSGWAPDFDRITIALNGGPTNTPAPVTATPTKTNTPSITNTSVGPTATFTRTNTPLPYTSTPTKTNTSLPPTVTPTASGATTSYESEAVGNTLAGGAVVSACGTCSGGNKVGYVGNDAGTLQYNGISAPTTGSYTLTMYYINGDAGARNATISVNGGAGTSLSFPVTGSWTAVGSIQTAITLNVGSANTIKFSNPVMGGWAPDFDCITVNTSGGPTNTPVGPTATITITPTRTNTSVAPTITPTSSGTSLLLDNFDGSPAWSTGTTNDLGKWAGANGFVNGTGGAGVESAGALALQYNNAGWFGSDVLQDISGKTYLVFVIKGAAGGEQTAFHISLGGVDKTFADFSGDTITTTYKTIRINMVTNGVNRTAPGQLNMTFWWGGSGTITIDEIRLE